ncbi:MAG: hypothetical protein HRU01_26405 [Myxococcales bacterium]|nr:hypothetical protein [Myxococcales bacterium]
MPDKADAPKATVFEFEPSEYADFYRENGYAHIPGGASAEFMRFALHFAESKIKTRGREELSDWQFKDKKLQFLMEFPDNCDYPNGLYRSVASVADLDVENMMIGERHIKIYEGNAPENPPPHKDRLASEITVGIGLKIPKNSRIVLYPEHELTVNPYQSAAQWRTSLDPEDLPEQVLAGVDPVEIDMRPGDVVMFAGNSIYHERTHPANAWVLYMKFNAMRLDPIAEDPKTLPQRQRSLALLAESSDVELLGMRVEVSPRLEKVSRHYTRQHWMEVLQGSILGEKKFTLSETEWAALRTLDDRNIEMSDLIARMGFPKQRAVTYVPFLRRLAKVGAIDVRD